MAANTGAQRRRYMHVRLYERLDERGIAGQCSDQMHSQQGPASSSVSCIMAVIVDLDLDSIGV
jgi:hypothetical protein